MDASDKELKELTVEVRREKTDQKTGTTSYYWHRPGNARNELWDLLVYGHAAVEMLAHNLCIEALELDAVDWPQFWRYIEEQQLYFSPAPTTD